MIRRRLWRAVLIAVAGAGALSGCYYDPYTGYYYPYPGYYPYPPSYPYAWRYPYSPAYPYSQPPAAPPPPPGSSGTVPPPNGPVQRAPLPPAPQ
jgi:hypothetical protein